jgi:predicted PurR-regulated permease PerM
VASIEERWRVHRAVAIAAVYLAFLVPLVLFFVIGGPRLFFETRSLFVRAPTLLAHLIEQAFGPGPYVLLGPNSSSREVAADLFGSLRDAIGSPAMAIHIATGVFEVVLGVFLSLIVSIYLLLDADRVNHFLMSFVPRDRRDDVFAVSEEIQRTLGRYLRRQLLLVGFVAGATFAGLEWIFHLHYALPVAIATGFMEIVPFVGPVAAGTIAVLIALSQGDASLAIGVIIFYLVLRQVEDQIVTPIVLGRAVELHPLVVIFAILAGSALFGILGTLVAIPVAASIKVVLDAWPRLVPARHQPPDFAVVPRVAEPQPVETRASEPLP